MPTFPGIGQGVFHVQATVRGGGDGVRDRGGVALADPPTGSGWFSQEHLAADGWVEGEEAAFWASKKLFNADDPDKRVWTFAGTMPTSPVPTYITGFNASGGKVHLRNVWQSKVTPTQSPDLFLSLAHATSDEGEAYVMVAIVQHPTQSKATVLGGFMDADEAAISFAYYAQQPAISTTRAGNAAAISPGCVGVSEVAAGWCLFANCQHPNNNQACFDACAALGDSVRRACEALRDFIDDILEP